MLICIEAYPLFIEDHTILVGNWYNIDCRFLNLWCTVPSCLSSKNSGLDKNCSINSRLPPLSSEFSFVYSHYLYVYDLINAITCLHILALVILYLGSSNLLIIYSFFILSLRVLTIYVPERCSIFLYYCSCPFSLTIMPMLFYSPIIWFSMLLGYSIFKLYGSVDTFGIWTLGWGRIRHDMAGYSTLNCPDDVNKKCPTLVQHWHSFGVSCRELLVLSARFLQWSILKYF